MLIAIFLLSGASFSSTDNFEGLTSPLNEPHYNTIGRISVQETAHKNGSRSNVENYTFQGKISLLFNINRIVCHTTSRQNNFEEMLYTSTALL